MNPLNDEQIAQRVEDERLISPYFPDLVREVEGKKIISFGQSSFGYDLRLAPEFLVCRPSSTAILDPKDVDPDVFDLIESDTLILPAGGFTLARSIETIRMPRDLTAVCMGKSTYARVGLIANTTPLEAGWRGEVTLELSNTSGRPIRVHAGEGIVQVIFYQGLPCKTSYDDRGGKYQHQKGITLPR